MGHPLHFVRAKQQELLIWADDLRYRARNGRAVTGAETGTDDLQELARARWGAASNAPFHVLYVGHPTPWEPHNLPSDPGLKDVVTTYWLEEMGLSEYDGPVLRHRNRVGPAIAARIEELRKIRPVHLVIAYLSGAHVLPGHVRAWAKLGVVTAAFHLDDRLYFRGPKVDSVHVGPADTAPAFDLNLTNVKRSLTKYAAVGARAIFWPEGANPAFFRPLHLERTHDVAFLGGRYGPRGEIVDRLAHDGFSVLARGPGWPEGEVPASEVPVVFNRGRVVLGFSGIGRSMAATCLKGRDFEAPMCGAAYVASWNPELPLVWDVNQEIAIWRSYSDLRRVVRALVADPARLSSMRERALARARGEHTWAKRVEQIARLLGHPWLAPSGP